MKRPPLTDAQREERDARRRITARKYLGDDRDSWAVFQDGRPAFTGLNNSSVSYYKGLVLSIMLKREVTW